jgi:hypothetical protein
MVAFGRVTNERRAVGHIQGRRWAGHESAVLCCLIFVLAFGAERERRHRGQWAVIGNILNNGETRATVSTIDKWVTIAPVLRVKEFSQAVITD